MPDIVATLDPVVAIEWRPLIFESPSPYGLLAIMFLRGGRARIGHKFLQRATFYLHGREYRHLHVEMEQGADGRWVETKESMARAISASPLKTDPADRSEIVSVVAEVVAAVYAREPHAPAWMSAGKKHEAALIASNDREEAERKVQGLEAERTQLLAVMAPEPPEGHSTSPATTVVCVEVAGGELNLSVLDSFEIRFRAASALRIAGDVFSYVEVCYRVGDEDVASGHSKPSRHWKLSEIRFVAQDGYSNSPRHRETVRTAVAEPLSEWVRTNAGLLDAAVFDVRRRELVDLDDQIAMWREKLVRYIAQTETPTTLSGDEIEAMLMYGGQAEKEAVLRYLGAGNVRALPGAPEEHVPRPVRRAR